MEELQRVGRVKQTGGPREALASGSAAAEVTRTVSVSRRGAKEIQPFVDFSQAGGEFTQDKLPPGVANPGRSNSFDHEFHEFTRIRE